MGENKIGKYVRVRRKEKAVVRTGEGYRAREETCTVSQGGKPQVSSGNKTYRCCRAHLSRYL